jgi:hypothetical protein
MGKFGNLEEAKAKANLNAEIKAMLMLLFQMFSGARQNTANKIHNFIPHLKRTDRDCGSLPFYSNTFTSHKTNKEHILLSMISMVIQTYWDIVDEAKEVKIEVIDEFSDVLTILKEISTSNIDDFGVYPISNLRFSLMSKENLDKIEVEEARKERAEAEQAEEREAQARKDEAEGKELMEKELGSEDTSTENTDDSASSEEETVSGEVPLKSESTDSTLENGASENTKVEESSSAKSEDDAAPSTTIPKLVEDQVSTDDADKCDGNCDDCDNPGCQSNEKEDNLEGAEVGGESIGDKIVEQSADSCCLDCDMEDQRKAEENVPGSLADEQGGKDTIPPMPEEEKDSQAAVDHETGDDQVSEPPAPPEN